MTLDEAIKHCKERASQDCSECAKEHLKLARWLEELKMLREQNCFIDYPLLPGEEARRDKE